MTLSSFNGCSGPCDTCQAHYTGQCLVTQKDDEYIYASPAWIKQHNVRIPPTEIEIATIMALESAAGAGNTTRRLAFQRDGLLSKVEELQDLIRRLSAKGEEADKLRNDFSDQGYTRKNK